MASAPQHLRARKRPWPAAPPRPAPVIDYPDRGVEPVIPEHRLATTDGTQRLEDRYADRDDVYVGSNMTMYYVEGSEEHSISPDVFVAFGVVRDRARRVWKAWEEGRLADFVLEVASRSTRARDEGDKRRIYERHGVAEYWQFDPTGEYLDPVLQGRRLNARGAYEPVPLATTPDGMLCGESRVLALRLCLDEGRLRLFDPATGEFLPSHTEERRASATKDGTIAEQADTIAEQADAIAEQADTIAEERRRREAAEAQVEELRRQLGFGRSETP